VDEEKIREAEKTRSCGKKMEALPATPFSSATYRSGESERRGTEEQSVADREGVKRPFSERESLCQSVCLPPPPPATHPRRPPPSSLSISREEEGGGGEWKGKARGRRGKERGGRDV
jgi:hypothetical protein